MTTPEAKMARIEEGQRYFREALTSMKEGQERLVARVDHVAEEMRRNSEKTTTELHTAALALTRCADRLDHGAEKMDDADEKLTLIASRLDKHDERITSLEMTRANTSAIKEETKARTALFLSGAGLAGAFGSWVITHAKDWLLR